jgi:lipopolysaccharide assembly outer membrane protein LptD (OstA)
VEQRFQTRRDGKLHTLLTVENYVDFHIDSQEGSEGIGDFGTKLEWRPFNGLSINTDVLIDLNEGSLNVFRNSASFKLTESVLATLGYQFRDDYTSRDLYSNGSNISTAVSSNSFATAYTKSHTVNARLSYMITPKNLIAGSVRYDFKREELVDQTIEFQHKMHCWTVSLFYSKDYDNETRVMLMFYLNAYPDVSISGG